LAIADRWRVMSGNRKSKTIYEITRSSHDPLGLHRG
jgi:hypothetical protein